MDSVNCKESPCAKVCIWDGYLPSDLITEIMIRLPVKPLLRFRCVSKQLRALIDSPYFIKKHLNHFVKSKTNHNLIFNACFPVEASSIYSVDLYLLDLLVEIKHPLKTYTFDAEIMSSVNGLICLRATLQDIVGWNPSTKKYLRVSSAFDHTGAHGFGYDSVSDDYKILCFYPFLHHYAGCIIQRCKVAVYSLRSSSWEFLHDFPYHLRHRNVQGYGVTVCGRLHWLVRKENVFRSPFLIAAFDLTTHSFSLVAHPNTLDKGFNKTDFNLMDMSIGELEGHLCVICDCSDRVDAWVMKKYQVRESWTKLFSIPKSDRVESYCYPFLYSKSGNEIMLFNEDRRLFRYDLKNEVLKKIEIRNFPCGDLSMAICLESLLPLDGM